MRRSLLVFASVFSLLVLAGCERKPPVVTAEESTAQAEEFVAPPNAASPTQDNAALELVKKLSLCVDLNFVGVGTDCVKKEFLPLLGLGKNDSVLYGQMGMNSDGRWFWFKVKKVSASGKTASIFDVTFDFERTISLRNHNNERIDGTAFTIAHGKLYGKIPANDTGIVSIYDLGRGYFLTEDPNGNVAMDIGLEKTNGHYGADSLLQKGRTVGSLMEERLTSLEKSGKGGPVYFKEAERRFNSEGSPEQKYWHKFYF